MPADGTTIGQNAAAFSVDLGMGGQAQDRSSKQKKIASEGLKAFEAYMEVAAMSVIYGT